MLHASPRPLVIAASCASTHCPTIYRVDSGVAIVQGALITGKRLRNLTLGPGEAAVEIPVALITEAASRLRAAELADPAGI